MLLQRLVEYAQRLESPPPYGYAVTPVRYEIHLAADGSPETPELLDLASQDDKRGQRRPVPNMQRSGTKAPPILLADRGDYTLGVAKAADDEGKARWRHHAYLQLVTECADETGSPGARAVVAFLSGAQQSRLVLPPDFDAGSFIEFRVEGRLVTQERAVQEFWERRMRPKEAGALQCVVCGNDRPALGALKGMIKGLPGSQSSGAALMSANAEAFYSYGKSDARISPICGDCADAFTKALNALLADRKQCKRIANAAFVFWTKEQVAFSFADLIDSPDPIAVRELIDSARTGKFDATLDAVPFYAVSLTANMARAVVRDWLDTTLGDVKASLARWFQRQRIVTEYGEEPRPLGIYALAAATVRDPQKELTSATVSALFRSAISGAPLPDRLIQQAVRRCQVEGNVTFPRAALLKLVLLSHQTNPQEVPPMVELQTDHPSPAYHCGRLLAVIDAVQARSSGGGIKSTMIDRYYGTASSAPASVFGTLVRGAQPHLAKLRKNRPGTAARLEEELEEVLAAIRQFPLMLTAQEQALFALGFYHQRAHDRALAREYARAKKGEGWEDDGEETPEDESAA